MALSILKLLRQRIYLCILVCLIANSTSLSAQRPNIVIIYADDLGYGDLSVLNSESKISTPNLDKLAAEGMSFSDAHSSSGVCTPSRYALLTGRYHWRKLHKIVNSFEPPVFDENTLTLPEMLQNSGYETACVGKWHLGWNWNFISKPSGETITKKGQKRKYYLASDLDWEKPISGGPLSHGFDYYFGDDVPNFPPYTFIENDRVVEVPTIDLQMNEELPEGNWECRKGPMAEGWSFKNVLPTITEKAVRWIKDQKDKEEPFFLYFSLTSPHAPIVPSDDFFGKSKAGPYGDFVEQSDWSAGQIISAIEEAGMTDNTIIIFSSDNGPEKYAYERIRYHDHRSMGELRGLKRDLWEGGHRVPFIIKWKDKIEAGTQAHQTISQVDIMATLANIINYRLPEQSAEDSYDIGPIIFQQFHGDFFREATIQNTQEERYAIRKGDWLLINYKTGKVTNVPKWFNEKFGYENHSLDGELYNLKEDPIQKINRYNDYPAMVTELKEILERYIIEGRSVPSRN